MELLDDMYDSYFKAQIDLITPLESLVSKYQPDFPAKDKYFLKELILWALSEFKVLNKERFTKGYQFNDPLADYLKGI